MTSFLRRTVGIGFFAFFLFATTGSVFAAPIGVTVAPIRYTINLDPGHVYSDTITVANPNDFILKVRPEFQDFQVTEGNNIQWIPSDVENPYRMTDWIRMSTDTISLKPHEEMRVPFHITVPASSRAGGRYAAIFFTAVTENADSNVGAIPRVGALIILNVNGDLKRTGVLSQLEVPWFVGRGPTVVSVQYMNTGTTHYMSDVSLHITNMFGRSTDLSVEQRFVYPGIQRTISVNWDKRLPLGLYKVTVSARDGNGTAQIANQWLLAMPLIIILPLSAILVAMFFGWKWFVSKFKIVRTVS